MIRCGSEGVSASDPSRSRFDGVHEQHRGGYDQHERCNAPRFDDRLVGPRARLGLHQLTVLGVLGCKKAAEGRPLGESVALPTLTEPCRPADTP